MRRYNQKVIPLRDMEIPLCPICRYHIKKKGVVENVEEEVELLYKRDEMLLRKGFIPCENLTHPDVIDAIFGKGNIRETTDVNFSPMISVHGLEDVDSETTKQGIDPMEDRKVYIHPLFGRNTTYIRTKSGIDPDILWNVALTDGNPQWEADINETLSYYVQKMKEWNKMTKEEVETVYHMQKLL